MATQGGFVRQLSLETSPHSWFCTDDPDFEFVGKVKNKPHLEIDVEGIEMDGYSTLGSVGEIHERPRWGVDLSADGHTDCPTVWKDEERHPASLAYTNCTDLLPVLWVQSPNNVRNMYEIPPNATLVVPAGLAHGFKCLPMPLNGEPKKRCFILRTRLRDTEHSVEQSVITYEAPIDDPDPCVYNPPHFQPWMGVLEQERNLTRHMNLVESTLAAGGPFNFAAAAQHSLRLASMHLAMSVCPSKEEAHGQGSFSVATVPVEHQLPPEELSDSSEASETDEPEGDRKPKASYSSKKRKAAGKSPSPRKKRKQMSPGKGKIRKAAGVSEDVKEDSDLDKKPKARKTPKPSTIKKTKPGSSGSEYKLSNSEQESLLERMEKGRKKRVVELLLETAETETIELPHGSTVEGVARMPDKGEEEDDSDDSDSMKYAPPPPLTD